MCRKKHKYEADRFSKDFKRVMPFFIALTVLTVVSFIIPLRPTESYSEKRELAKFPEFSLTALADGSYFSDISLWYSDTFPGREDWIGLSTSITAFHGHSEIAIQGDFGVVDEIPVATEVLQVPETKPQQPEETPEEEVVAETVAETEPAETEPETWGGLNAEEYEVSNSAVVQIGDCAFNTLGFSKTYSDKYVELINDFAKAVEPMGVRVVSCPAPTAIGILVEKEYMPMLNSSPQDEMLNYLHTAMVPEIATVDTVSALIKHNSEYLYFRTDHHWTALGAYYAYEAMCKELGYEPAPLDSFEEWNQGDFKGSIYYKAKYPTKLRVDEVIAYVPQGDIEATYSNDGWNFYPTQVIADVTTRPIDCRYLCFLSAGNPITKIVNHDLPDAPNCVVIIDSYGNCFAPFLTQNYNTVYAIDYRKYNAMNLQTFCEKFDIDDVIVAPYMMATQSAQVNSLFRPLYGV